MPFFPPRSSGGVPRPMYTQRSGVPFQSRRQGRPYYNSPPGQQQPYYNNPPVQQQPFNNYGPYQQQPFNNPNYQQQPYYQQQPQGSGFGRFPDQLNRIMGHAGTITNGVNMMRQMGAIFSLFR